MPEGRLIKHEVVEDYRLGNVPIEAEFLYGAMLRKANRDGLLVAHPQAIKRKFFPARDYSNEQIEQWLKDLQSQKDGGLGLIELYEVDGVKYLWLPRFEASQSESWRKFVKPREAPSDIPLPPGLKPEPPKPKAKPLPVEDPDPALAKVVKCYESNIGIVTPIIAERLKDIARTYPEGWFDKAVEEACISGKRSLKYIERILERYQQEGLNPLKETSSGTHKGHNKEARETTILEDSIGKPLV